MRRTFVIFLILLFPLNVLALSMSVSSVQQDGALSHVLPSASHEAAGDSIDGFERQSIGDVDADEPPSGTDFHDSVNPARPLQCIVLPDGSTCSHLPSQRGLAPYPPIKPPPVQ